MWLKEVQRGGGGGGRFNYGRFMARRFLRIWPAMALALAVWTAFGAAASASGSAVFDGVDAPDACREGWWTVLLFVNNVVRNGCLTQT